MKYVLVLLLVLVNAPVAAIEVTHFKSGLACTNSAPAPGRDGWICQPTQDVLVTDQGSCVYDGVTQACTWIGYEFDYAHAGKHTKLACVTETSKPTDLGNPGGVIAKQSTSQPFELELEGESGHFYNPMYFTFSVTRPEDSVLVDTVTCKADGMVLFQAKYTLHFPASGG